MPLNDDLGRTILACNFEGIAFPVQAAPARESHSGAKHMSLQRRGADCEPTGLDPVSGTLRAAFLNDLEQYQGLYPTTYRELIEKLRTTPIGRLAHPFLGVFQAFVEAWEHEFDEDTRNGCFVTLHFTEHNGGAQLVSGDSGETPTDSPSAANSRATSADSAMAATGAPLVTTDPTGYTPLASLTSTTLASLESSSTLGYSEIVSSIDSLRSAVDRNISLTRFAGVDGHAAVVALEDYRTSVLALRTRYLARFERVSTYTVPRPMALFQIALSIYGDASRTDLLRAMNAIADPLLVPAGRVLQIVPADA